MENNNSKYISLLKKCTESMVTAQCESEALVLSSQAAEL